MLTALNSAVAAKSNNGHTHDDRYYTETEIVNLLAGQQDVNVTQTYPVTTNGNWVIVQKEGYNLIAAYSICSDTSCYVKGIQKHGDAGKFILVIDGLTTNTAMTFWLVWARL